MPTQLKELDVDPVTRGHLERALSSLGSEFAGVFAPETIERYMTESLAEIGPARVESFVPLFAHRFARERLKALAQSEGMVTKDVPEVLFVCVHNAGRSQMAAGLLSKLAEGRVHVRTAGSDPADEINPAAVEAMREVGVDLSQEFPKPLNDEFVRAADAVITMGCGDACPIYPGKRYEDWELDDPAGEDVEAVRPIRDEIERRVRVLLDEIAPEAAAS
ncbi:MAG: arsenate reductase ArsC [Solirubrobacterales bacterium]|nr:arsenate reductase ArsC [Solirubrobacterales bacterium]